VSLSALSPDPVSTPS
jgi:nuclear GTP-binding protein